MLILVSIFCGYVGFTRPVYGFSIFFFFQTGLSGLFVKIQLLNPQLGPFQAGITAYIGAIIALLQRKESFYNNSGKLDITLILVWIFTIFALLSRMLELKTILSS